MIKPTIGRRVWFYPNGTTQLADPKPLAIIDSSQPLDAGVVFVWSDRMVNLDVTDHYGQHHSANSVTLVQEGDPVPTTGFYATWMPYQQGQSKKAEAAT
jgi:hypothetical protein